MRHTTFIIYHTNIVIINDSVTKYKAVEGKVIINKHISEDIPPAI